MRKSLMERFSCECHDILHQVVSGRGRTEYVARHMIASVVSNKVYPLFIRCSIFIVILRRFGCFSWFGSLTLLLTTFDFVLLYFD